jgi:uracil-DNA glycosylase
MSNLDAWLDALISFKSPNVFNPWRDVDPLDAVDFAPADRVIRLQRHLACDPLLILIGEAPGYLGCKFSGIPFTNEKLLTMGAIPRIAATGRITKRALPFCEPSATIMWGALRDAVLADRVVMWNAFAFHPHKEGNLLSNRAPTRSELGQGLPILRGFLKFYPGVPIVPVGKVAERTLASLGVATLPALRHPAMGGANQFRSGIAELAGTLER